MPIEIRELHIRATVNQDDSTGGKTPVSATISQEDKDAIIAECVEKVLQVLKKKKDR